MSESNTSGDSKELEDLFDSIASANSVKVRGAVPAPATPARPSVLQQLREGGNGDDSDELQALFDSIVAATPPTRGSSPTSADGEPGEAVWPGQQKVFCRVGQMARQLHTSLGELGYHKLLEEAASAIPDARDRLAYVATLTEKAACKVLNATDVANPLQEELEEASLALATRWDAVFANQLGVDDFKRLADETRAFLRQGLPQKTAATKTQLLEIMMAQDFQDLTGQVIKKIIAVAQELESELMGVLIEVIPGERRTDSVLSLLNGPVINAEGRGDVVATQQQVDDLLGSLGF